MSNIKTAAVNTVGSVSDILKDDTLMKANGMDLTFYREVCADLFEI